MSLGGATRKANFSSLPKNERLITDALCSVLLKIQYRPVWIILSRFCCLCGRSFSQTYETPFYCCVTFVTRPCTNSKRCQCCYATPPTLLSKTRTRTVGKKEKWWRKCRKGPKHKHERPETRTGRLPREFLPHRNRKSTHDFRPFPNFFLIGTS